MAQYQGWGGPGSGQQWQQPRYDAQAASYGGGVNNRGGMFQPMNWGGARPSWAGAMPQQTATSTGNEPISWGGYVRGQYRGLDAPQNPLASGTPPAAAPALENAAPQSAVQSGIPYQALATALANPATGSGEGPYAPSVASQQATLSREQQNRLAGGRLGHSSVPPPSTPGNGTTDGVTMIPGFGPGSLPQGVYYDANGGNFNQFLAANPGIPQYTSQGGQYQLTSGDPNYLGINWDPNRNLTQADLALMVNPFGGYPGGQTAV